MSYTSFLLAFALAFTVNCSKSPSSSEDQPQRPTEDKKTEPSANEKAPPSPPESGTSSTEKKANTPREEVKSPPKTGAKKISNLKILPSSWSYDKVKSYMKDEFNRGLGVKCDFCHNKDDFASDKNNHKVVARWMMRMTNDMNKSYFKGKPKVTCFTCHNGQTEP